MFSEIRKKFMYFWGENSKLLWISEEKVKKKSCSLCNTSCKINFTPKVPMPFFIKKNTQNCHFSCIEQKTLQIFFHIFKCKILHKTCIRMWSRYLKNFHDVDCKIFVFIKVKEAYSWAWSMTRLLTLNQSS